MSSNDFPRVYTPQMYHRDEFGALLTAPNNPLNIGKNKKRRSRSRVVSSLLIGATLSTLIWTDSQASHAEQKREVRLEQKQFYFEDGKKKCRDLDPIVLATVVTLLSGTSWTVPADWSTTNTIECYGGGGGGGGGGGSDGAGSGGFGGGGGGSGSYAKNTNQTGLSGSIPYSLGAGGALGGGGAVGVDGNPGGGGGDTNFNSGQCIGKGGSFGTGGQSYLGTNPGVGGAGGILGTGTTRTVGQSGAGGSGITHGAGGVGTNSFGNGGDGGDSTTFSIGVAGVAGVAGRIVITYTPTAGASQPWNGQWPQLGPILAQRVVLEWRDRIRWPQWNPEFGKKAA